MTYSAICDPIDEMSFFSAAQNHIARVTNTHLFNPAHLSLTTQPLLRRCRGISQHHNQLGARKSYCVVREAPRGLSWGAVVGGAVFVGCVYIVRLMPLRRTGTNLLTYKSFGFSLSDTHYRDPSSRPGSDILTTGTVCGYRARDSQYRNVTVTTAGVPTTRNVRHYRSRHSR